jgi:hypothetical protein
MLEQVEQALDRQDYRAARHLIKTLAHNQPSNERVHILAARLQEATEHFENAETIYRQLLQSAIDPKVLQEARQGIGRLLSKRDRQLDTEKSAALEIEGGRDPALLVLEPVPTEAKGELAPKLGKLLNLDAYTARMHLPSRGWRLYRVGFLGELSLYERRLKAVGIPSFCAPTSHANSMDVAIVQVFDEFRPQAIARCTNDYGAEMVMGFLWPEVTSIVSGLLPIFEELNEVTSTTTKTTITRKPKILDYVQICDLHVPGKNLIFRVCSKTYAYQKADGEKTGDFLARTSHENWQRLLNQIFGRTVQAKMYSEFTVFAETAMDYPELLDKINPHLNLLRDRESYWDRAFQLYSSLIFNRHAADLVADLN